MKLDETVVILREWRDETLRGLVNLLNTSYIVSGKDDTSLS